MTLFERLRDAPAICTIPQQGGVGTPTVGLTERERAAVLNLIEAAQRLCGDDSVRRLSDHWAFPLEEFEALCEAVAPFIEAPEGERAG